jgi:hypothetical protein
MRQASIAVQSNGSEHACFPALTLLDDCLEFGKTLKGNADRAFHLGLSQ